jgi:hypothetical protein
MYLPPPPKGTSCPPRLGRREKKGICMVCGCTEQEGSGPNSAFAICSWANIKQTLCTACAPLNPPARREKQKRSLERLVKRYQTLTDEALDLKARIGVLDR